MICNLQAKTLLMITLFACSHGAIAQKRLITSGNPSPIGIEVSPYLPKMFSTLDILPGPIRAKAENHLRERLGNDFYSRLVFVGGSSIDVKEFLRIKPGTQWKVHSYELVFKYANLARGLKEYYARTRLDSSGDVVAEIDLPEVSRFPLKADIISVDRAVDMAKLRGFKPKKMAVSFLYDTDSGSCTWVFESFAFEDRYTASTKVLIVDAHSGFVLKDGLETGIK